MTKVQDFTLKWLLYIIRNKEANNFPIQDFQEKIFGEAFLYILCPFIWWREYGYREVPHREGIYTFFYNMRMKIFLEQAILKIFLNYATDKTLFNTFNLQF